MRVSRCLNSQLLAYRRGQYDPSQLLEKVLRCFPALLLDAFAILFPLIFPSSYWLLLDPSNDIGNLCRLYDPSNDIGNLCCFFCQRQSNDFLLPILPAFLNDRDEQLSAVFYGHIVLSAFLWAKEVRRNTFYLILSRL